MVQTLRLKLKEQKGFTLIELLAVIVILGIIAAIAIPAIGNVISKSDDKAQIQEGLQILNAAKYYVTDKNPTGADLTALATAGTGLEKTKLAPYLDRVKDNTFEVLVSYDSTSGKYTYKLTKHASLTVYNKGKADAAKKTEVTEQDLIDWK